MSTPSPFFEIVPRNLESFEWRSTSWVFFAFWDGPGDKGPGMRGGHGIGIGIGIANALAQFSFYSFGWFDFGYSFSLRVKVFYFPLFFF